MSDPNKALEKKEGQSEALTAKPQVAHPRAKADMPKLTPGLCPHCHAENIVRSIRRTWRIGEHAVYACRQLHRWSPKGGEAALKLLQQQQAKMRRARAKAPVPVAAKEAAELIDVEDATN